MGKELEGPSPEEIARQNKEVEEMQKKNAERAARLAQLKTEVVTAKNNLNDRLNQIDEERKKLPSPSSHGVFNTTSKTSDKMIQSQEVATQKKRNRGGGCNIL